VTLPQLRTTTRRSGPRQPLIILPTLSMLSGIVRSRYWYPKGPFHIDNCDKCRHMNPIRFTVQPEGRGGPWRSSGAQRLCRLSFDAKAEKADARCSFAGLNGMSWSHRPPPKRSR